MHGDCCVAQHRLRARRRHLDKFIRTAFDRIPNVIELPFKRFVFDFQVRQCRTASRTPVDQPLTTVDQAFLIQAHEHFADGTRKAFFKGEALPGPVAGISDAADLLRNEVSVLPLPCPDTFYELFPAQVVTGQTLFTKLPFHHVLSGYPGMIGPRQPQCIKALHSLATNDDVMHRVVEHVSHVKRTGHVGRGHHNNKRWIGRIGIGPEIPLVLPEVVPTGFHIGRVVYLRDLSLHCASSTRRLRPCPRSPERLPRRCPR